MRGSRINWSKIAERISTGILIKERFCRAIGFVDMAFDNKATVGRAP